ncbi:DUF975 family protein [Pseudomonas sp. 5P_3.1_Bac2]|uniref:DUF975 family protein n=1 Tax=Pseudomonas sp. 5P_3.1_Bac2 TaxID=2971617 RepID=UPI0021C89BA8|nr:DUF975 family protein [Pseudomonas sp. 5P_3.1_Bac2]MCU1715711.1 DUF975 family protein [Pseudomonas sp. 5P_3.1_Bac2]
MSEVNPYAAPNSSLQHPVSTQPVLSIEKALQRGYDFSIDGLISEAWQLVKGSKGILFAGFVVFYLIIIAISIALTLAFGGVSVLSGSAELGIVGELLTNLLVSALTYPFLAGIMMVGIRRAAGQPIAFNQLFQHFDKLLPLVITGVLSTLLISIGFMLFVLPGLYLSIAYMLAMPLVVERGLSPWQALETSRKAISQHWFKVLALLVVLTIIVLISAIPLGIGLIWSLPLLIIASGVLYRTIFGVLPAAQ